MKELNSITEYQMLFLASCELMRRIEHEEKIDRETQNEYGRHNRISTSRLKMYNEQLNEIHGRILEIEQQNAAE